MADSDFSVRAIISAQTSQFEKGMKDAQKSLGDVSKSIQNVSNLLKSAFSVAGIALSVKAITDFGSSCVKAADEANKSFSILNNTINVTGATAWTSAEKMEQMSIEISDATNYSVGEIQDMQSVLLGFRNITGDTFREASDAITDMATVMGMDLKSAVQTVGKALDDPIKGLDSLKRQGFAFTEQQKEELDMLVKTGKQMEAQKIILDELNTTYGGAAKAAQSATARWNHAMDSLKESIGNQLMPAVNASTEQMTKVLKKITDFVNSSEFNQIVIVLTNIANKVKEVFVVIGNYISEVFTEIMEIFNKVDFSPFKSILDTLLGSIMKIVDIIKQRIDEGIKRFKAVANEIGNIVSSLDLEGISEYINAFIDGFWFIYDEVQKVTQEIQDWITEKIIWIWEKIKELFNNSNDALANSESSIKSWSDFFWKILDNVFRIFQDLINSIKAILHGDWKVAWEYAKLTVARVADNMLTIFSTIANAFPKLINGLIGGLNKLIEQINKFREWLGDDPLGLLESFTSVDLSEKSGLNEFIKETERNIENLTGKAADISIKNLKGISTESKGTFDKLKSEITATGNVSISTSNKSHKTYMSNLNSSSDSSNEFFNQLKKGWQDLKEEIEKDSKDWSDVIKTSYTSITNVTNNMFVMMGENLAGASNGYQEFSATAVEGISEILKALAAQITALGVTHALSLDFAGAALAAAGAAAALVAAGTLAATAKQMRGVSDAAKDASSSLEEFKKRLAEIWSGATSTSGFVSSLVQMNSVVETTRANVEKAQKAYRDLYASQKDYVQNVWNTYFNGSLYGGWGYEIYEGFYKLKKSYGKLTLELEKYKEALKTLEESRGKLIQQQEESIETTRLEIKVYEDLYSSIFKLKGVSDDYTNVLNANVKILKNEIFSKLQEEVKSLYSSLINIGSDLGKSITDGIKNGVTKSDFMETVKEYIKNKVIELVVYTDEFNSQLAEIGTKLASAIASGLPNEIAKATKQIEKLYESASNAAKKASDAIDEANKKISNSLSERVKKSIENIKETFKQKFEEIEAIAQRAKEAAEKLKAKYEEIGSSLGQTLINSLVNGAKKEDFSKELGNYFKNQLVQVVIYTQEFTEKMTAFGEKIYKALMSGNQISVIKLKSEIEKYFSTKQSEIKVMSDFINSIFGKEAEKNVSSSANTVVENVSKIQKAIDNLKDSLKDLGGDVASNFISSLNSGLDLDSALISFKKFIRNYMIQSAVYTDSLKSEMEKIGQGIADYIMGKNSGLDKISSEFKKTYNKLANNISKADEYLDKIFGKEKEEEIKDSSSTITKELSKIESAMKSFKETVSDLGGDIASNLIDGISNGLSQSDFLSNMKDWIKKMLVQSVVYTEQMKSQIEAIGKAISNAISGGFTETSMHEIRRDLSFIFEQASSKMSGIDKILGGVFDGYASGTTSALSGLHIVGECGPELVKFKGGEHVYNNADTMKIIAGAGKTNNMSITFNNMKDTSAFAMMSQLKQYQRELAINGVL